MGLDSEEPDMPLHAPIEELHFTVALGGEGEGGKRVYHVECDELPVVAFGYSFAGAMYGMNENLMSYLAKHRIESLPLWFGRTSA